MRSPRSVWRSIKCSRSPAGRCRTADAVNLARGAASPSASSARSRARPRRLPALRRRKAVGALEAKKEGTPLTERRAAVATKYADGLPDDPPRRSSRCPSPTCRPAPRPASPTARPRRSRAATSSRSTGPRRSPSGSTSSTRTRRHAPSPPAAAAGARRRLASGRRRSRAIRNLEESLAEGPPARADPDGDRLAARPSPPSMSPTACQVRRRRAHPLPRRPGNLGRQTLKEFQQLHRRRTTAGNSPSSTTSSTSTRTRSTRPRRSRSPRSSASTRC